MSDFDLTRPIQVLLDGGRIVTAVAVTAQNARSIANQFGGEVLGEKGKDVIPETVGVRLPSLYGALEARLGEIVIKDQRNRLSTMDQQQFEQSLLVRNPDKFDHQNEYPTETIIENTHPDIQSEEDLQAVHSRNLFEERQRRLRS